MKGRIAARFEALRRENRGALIPFVEAHDPDAETSMAILRGLPGAGADLIEIGMPFSDPMADGPAIQKAARRALLAGAGVEDVLAMVHGFRAGDAETPVVLMGYYNPMLSYGVERFCAAAASAGADGLIVVDVPPEEADEMEPHTLTHGLDLIRLVAPTTDDERLPRVLAATSGFVYHVSITGITGTASASSATLAAAIPRIRRHTDLPVAVGFGIRTPEQAAAAVRVADAAVVGSALVDTIAGSLDGDGRACAGTANLVLDQVRRLADAVRAARTQSVAA